MKRPAIQRCLVLVLTCLILAALTACHRRPGLQTGDPFPQVTLIDFHGKSMTLPEDIKGKVVLLRFWSMDCSQCNKKVIFSLELLYHKYQQQGFLPIAIHQGKPINADERFRQFDHLTYPMLIDEYGKVARQFGIRGLPATFVFDEEGILREKIIGEVGIDSFEKILTTVLYKGGFYESAY